MGVTGADIEAVSTGADGALELDPDPDPVPLDTSEREAAAGAIAESAERGEEVAGEKAVTSAPEAMNSAQLTASVTMMMID